MSIKIDWLRPSRNCDDVTLTSFVTDRMTSLARGGISSHALDSRMNGRGQWSYVNGQWLSVSDADDTVLWKALRRCSESMECLF